MVIWRFIENIARRFAHEIQDVIEFLQKDLIATNIKNVIICAKLTLKTSSPDFGHFKEL